MLYNDKLKYLRKAGNVKRYHTWSLIGENLVATHSWNLVTLLLCLKKSVSKELVLAALYHDAAEHQTGDVPHTTKQEGSIKHDLEKIERRMRKAYDLDFPLTEEEEHWLEACDKLELILFCMDQRKLGNRSIKPVIRNASKYLWEHENTPEEVLDFLREIENPSEKD